MIGVMRGVMNGSMHACMRAAAIVAANDTARPARSGRSARRGSLLLAAVVLLLAACASPPAPQTLRFGLDDAPEGRRLMWPPLDDVPRYVYAGTLTGEANFAPTTPARGIGIGRFLRWLAGIDGSGQRPDVLQRPVAVVSDEAGRIYVSDVSRQAIFVFDERAGALAVWDRADGMLGFVAPSGLALDSGRGLLVADAELGAVVRLDASGTPRALLGKGLLKRPTGVARDAGSGRIYVADTYAHDIKVFDDAGSLLQVIGRRGEAAGEFNFPTHLAFANERLFVTDSLNSRVQVLDGAGKLPPTQIGTRGLYVGNLVRPKGVAVDGEGNVYVVESYFDALLVFASGGDFLMPIGGTGTGTGRFYLPSGVWVDSRNRVFVADMFNGRVVVFQFLGGGDAH